MTQTPEAVDPAYHLILDGEESAVAASALRLLIDDLAHEPAIRAYARDVLGALADPPEPGHTLTLPLAAEQMKVLHTAVKLLFDDLQREQAQEREVLRRILDKLPDEHAMRAIRLT